MFFLLSSGAPEKPLTVRNAASTISVIGLGGSVGISVVTVALSVSLQPLQFRMVQLLEGYWPIWKNGLLFQIGVARQRARYDRLVAQMSSSSQFSGPDEERAISERIDAATEQVSTRFPEPDRFLPTALGNVLRAAEDRVGVRYGLDSIIVWPRLFRLLPQDLQASIEDEVTQLDVSCRLVFTWSAAGVAGTVILMQDIGAAAVNFPWAFLVACFWLLAGLSYRFAVESALAHALDVEVALDLHRGLVIDAMRLPPAGRLSEERRLFRKLCRLFETYDEAHSQDFKFK